MLHGLAAMRMIKYLYAKLLYLFGLASNNPKLAEAVWSQVSGSCTVLYSTVLYCTVLYCTVLYCTVLCCQAEGPPPSVYR